MESESQEFGIDKDSMKYPCLMVSKNKLVVLFTEKRKGTVVNLGSRGDIYYLGEFYDKWTVSSFKPYLGKITLTSDPME